MVTTWEAESLAFDRTLLVCCCLVETAAVLYEVASKNLAETGGGTETLIKRSVNIAAWLPKAIMFHARLILVLYIP